MRILQGLMPHTTNRFFRILVVLILSVFTLTFFPGSKWISRTAIGMIQSQSEPQVGPGIPLVGSAAQRRLASSTKAGSLLFFPKYTSDPATPNTVNTLLTVTNTNPRDPIAVRIFFIHEGGREDLTFSLVANQSRTFVASRESAGHTGYAMAVAINSQGLPTQFNWLIGAALLRDEHGHEAGYNAFSVAKRSAGPLSFVEGGGAAELLFNNEEYDRLPKRIAIDSIQNQDESVGPAQRTDVGLISPSLAPATGAAMTLTATAYGNEGVQLRQDLEIGSQLFAPLSQIWTSIPLNSLIGVNRNGWAVFSAKRNETDLPVLGLSLTDGTAEALHSARIMHVLEWLESYGVTMPVRAPENPVTDVAAAALPANAGGDGATENKAGSLLIYPRFVSGDYGATQIALTNTNPVEKVRVRVFFTGLVDPAEVKETIFVLQALQTVVVNANDVAASQRGWILAMAIDNRALPIQFNHLVGSAQVNEASGQRAAFNAISFARINPSVAGRNPDLATSNVQFNDVDYDRLPATTAMAMVPSQIDNSSLLGFGRLPASLLDPPNTRGAVTVMLYDELLASFGANVPRTETRLNQIRSSVLTPPITSTLQPGQHGWLKLLSATPAISWSITKKTVPFSISSSGSWRGGFNGDGNLHALTVTDTATLKVPSTNPNNRPPSAVAETIGLQVEARRSDGVIVRLDASASTDPDPDEMLTYQWFDNDQTVSSARIADRKLDLGLHRIKLVVTDGSGVAGEPAEQTVNVVDTTPPQISGIPSAIAKSTDQESGEAINFLLPTAHDMVDGPIVVQSSIAPGAVFPIGKTVVTFTARDQAGNRATATVDVTLTRGESKPQTGGVAGNRLPVIPNLNDQYVKAGTVRNLIIQATDADGDAVTFSMTGGPAYAQIISGDPGARNATLRIAPPASETSVATNVRILANDGKGQPVATLPFRIFVSSVPNDDTGSGVSANRPPVANLLPLPAIVAATSKNGAEVTLDASRSSDPDGDPLTFTWFDGESMIGRGAILPTQLLPGVHFLRVTIFDGKDGITTTAPVRVDVTPRPLSIDAVSPPILNRNITATLTVTGTGFMPGSMLSFTKDGIAVTNYGTVEEDKIVATLAIAASATQGTRDVIVINPNGTSVRLRSAIFVNR